MWLALGLSAFILLSVFLTDRAAVR